jgi:hypothetical protein
MSDSYLALLAAITARLTGDATLIALVPAARIYNDVPDNVTFPFIVVRIESAPFDTKTENGMTHTVTVSAFDRKSTSQSVAAIRARVYDLLHKQEAAIGAGLNFINFTGVNPVIKDPDGRTWQAVAQFDATIS